MDIDKSVKDPAKAKVIKTVKAKVIKTEVAVKSLEKGAGTIKQETAEARENAEKACKEAELAKKGSVTAQKDAADAKWDAERARKDAAEAKKQVKEAKESIKKAQVVNISLFTANTIAEEEENKKEENVSVVKPSDFKVESLSDLFDKVNEWWRDILRWMGRQQLNILVLFSGVLLTFLLVAFIGRLVGKLIMWRVKKHKYSEWGEQICNSLSRPFSFLVFTIGVFLSSLRLLNELNEDAFAIALRTFFALMAFAVTWGIYRLVEVLDHYLEILSSSSDNNLDNLLAGLIGKTLRFTIVFVAVLFIGQAILGLRITALVAGAGIAGLAVALAAKDTLANFFGSVMIMLDKPFTVGERVALDTLTGTVEKIGFRSTRIRSLSGHMYSIPNSKLADSIVENIAKRPYIKYSFDLTLVYDTSVEKMERAMEILHEILDNHEGFGEELPPRIYFTEFKDWALNISVILWFQSTDYFHVQQWKNDINLEILRRFNEEGLDFAFPTSTNYLVGDESRELKITEVKVSENKN
jgi:MscS family membrane protein